MYFNWYKLSKLWIFEQIIELYPQKSLKNVLHVSEKNHFYSIFCPVRESQQNQALVKKYFLQDIRVKKFDHRSDLYLDFTVMPVIAWSYVETRHLMANMLQHAEKAITRGYLHQSQGWKLSIKLIFHSGRKKQWWDKYFQNMDLMIDKIYFLRYICAIFYIQRKVLNIVCKTLMFNVFHSYD